MPIPDEHRDRIWRFWRGDMPISDFERWVYAETTLEDTVGSVLYFELISTDFRSKDARWRLRRSLIDWMEQVADPRCECQWAADTDFVDMGDQEDLFRTFEHVRHRGHPYWWLSMYRCGACNQGWLVAQEERIYLLYCLRRVDPSQFDRVVRENEWPGDFDHYEHLLQIGQASGRTIRWVDPMASLSLRDTVTDLAKARPHIRVAEISALLGLDLSLATELARRAVQTDDVDIEFDIEFDDANG